LPSPLDDLDAETADWRKGDSRLSKPEPLVTQKWAYFDGEKLGGMIIELLQPPKK